MSLYYRHFLIPVSAQFRPDAASVCRFVGEVIEGGYVAQDYKLAYSRVRKHKSRVRDIVNPFTGETFSRREPSRRVSKPQPFQDVRRLVSLADSEPEYDVSITSESIPACSPLDIGFVQEGVWRPVDCHYYLEVRCSVRSQIVRLSALRTEEELYGYSGSAEALQPTFDEDCSEGEAEGLFVHPETGAIRIPNAGCGMFWVEFDYGKFLFPRLQDSGVDLLDKSLVSRAESAFDVEFVQACDWG